jgi:predicted dehydrogenase
MMGLGNEQFTLFMPKNTKVMNSSNSTVPNRTSRREFLKTSGAAAAGAALAGAIARPGYAAENNTIKIAIVGCGGRGTGAVAEALSTRGPTKLWAMADFFEHRLTSSLELLKKRFPNQVEVPPEHQFFGFDAFKKAIDALDKGDVVLLTTPPAFRPMHLEYAVAKGVNVFMEKSFAVDAPGIRRVLKAGQVAAQKNLKIAGGLMSRHSKPLEEAILRIHEGIIGEIITVGACRMHGPVGFAPKHPGETELAHQIASYSNYTWLNGSFYLDWLIHNVDVACWLKNDWPVSAQGMGGRQVRTEDDQLFDHYMAEHHFPDGTQMIGQGRHMINCHEFWGVVAHGTTGCAVLGEGQPRPRIFKGHNRASENELWAYKDQPFNAYQYEHDLLFDAIRNDKPYNETERCAKSCMVGIMGRMACESGKLVTWDEALASNIELAPGLDHFTLDSNPPVMPDANNRYPVAMPGKTQGV